MNYHIVVDVPIMQWNYISVCGNLQEGQLFYFANFQNCYLDMNGFSKAADEKFQTFSIQSPTKTNQMYYIKQHPSLNYYMIISYDSNMTLDVNSTNLVQQKPHCGISQQFKFVSDINNTCYIYSALDPNTSLLTSFSATNCSSQPVRIYPWSLSNSVFQKWSFFQVPGK